MVTKSTTASFGVGSLSWALFQKIYCVWHFINGPTESVQAWINFYLMLWNCSEENQKFAWEWSVAYTLSVCAGGHTYLFKCLYISDAYSRIERGNKKLAAPIFCSSEPMIRNSEQGILVQIWAVHPMAGRLFWWLNSIFFLNYRKSVLHNLQPSSKKSSWTATVFLLGWTKL